MGCEITLIKLIFSNMFKVAQNIIATDRDGVWGDHGNVFWQRI